MILDHSSVPARNSNLGAALAIQRFALIPFTVLGRARAPHNQHQQQQQQPLARPCFAIVVVVVVARRADRSSAKWYAQEVSRRFLRSVDNEPWLHVVVACRSLSPLVVVVVVVADLTLRV